MPWIRTTQQPERLIEVSDGEYDYLLSVGLIYSVGAGPAPSEPFFNVRLRVNPSVVVTIGETEYFDLLRQDLIYSLEGGPPINQPEHPPVQSEALANHIAAESPHPVYDNLPSLSVIFKNGLV